MKNALGPAAAVLIALLASAAHGQTGGARIEGAQAEGAQAEAAQAGEPQSGLAPDQAAAPAERPEDKAGLAPADGAPAPAPRPEAAAAPEAPVEAPAPEQAPEAPAQAPVPEDAPEAPVQAPVPAEGPATAPVPETGPEAPSAAPGPAGDSDAGAEAPAEAPRPAEPPVPELLAEDDAEFAACLGRLGALGAVFERVEPVGDAPGGGGGNGGAAGACGIANPIRVTGIVPGVALEPAGIMRCATAAALAEWVAIFVLPASRFLPERGRLAALEQASAYVCRRIGADGDLSQHAFGNAVDIAAFRFAQGPAVPIEPRERDGTAAEAFQRTARASACLLFSTVLGPGQEDHDDHLHLDIAARASGYRLCQ
jgi:hypothetical protein